MRGLCMCVALLMATPAWAAKWYVVVRGVEDADGVHSGIRDEALRVFTDELKKHPELTLEAPPVLPTEPEALEKALVAKKLKALELNLRILAVSQEVSAPGPGKRFR